MADKDNSKELKEMVKLMEQQHKLASDMMKNQADAQKMKQMMDAMTKMMKKQADTQKLIIKNLK